MTDNSPEPDSDQERHDPEGNAEQTGRRPDPDGNFSGGDAVTPEDHPSSRIPEDADGNFGDDPVSEPEEGAGGTSPGP